jgi:hypothetical protein
MSELDRTRVALIVASPTDGGHRESVGTGYFLTGDLVLTVRHLAEGPDCTFNVRAEVGATTEAELWSTATPQWIGVGDVDAMLLRTARRFGDWPLPALGTPTGAGAWRSSGYARAAADTGNEHRKTLPLEGSFGMSLGQGPAQIVLQTNQSISPDWDTYWQGVSGAPIFSLGPGDEDQRLIGIITEASRALTNSLIGLSAARLLDDIRFRSIVTPSFLGPPPDGSFCAVLTSENSRSDLLGQTEGVLAGFRTEDVRFQRIRDKPFTIPVAGAVRSPENWAATVDVLARADYLIADVTGFEPAVMLLLGVRSVLRRGVTISVTEGQPVTSSSSLPFNIQETKILSYDDADFYDKLHLAMAEGAANLAKDLNYLDLPAYYSARAPRPERWTDSDDKTVLFLCPFSTDYSPAYQKLRPIIRAHTGNMVPLRTLDLPSPRLVGQALYEQIRWSSWCLIDWTEWRPNVFFELGVRLACSERDPLCIIQQEDAASEHPAAIGAPVRLHQHEHLLRLFDPVEYEPQNPRSALRHALESWPSPPSSGNGRPFEQATLPPAATFRTAQASFQWQRDPALIPPHIEQRRAAELIFGQDQERLPQGRVLFANNEEFAAELRAAVREKWIAAWLYLRHLSTGEDAVLLDEAELTTMGSLADYALSSSDHPRHIRVREEIRDFLKSRELVDASAKPINEMHNFLDEVLSLKASGKSARDTGNWDRAISDLSAAADKLRAGIPETQVVVPGRLATELADVYGLMGGVEKRWGLALTGEARRQHLVASLTAYERGFSYERDLQPQETYNRVNRLVGHVLLNPRILEDESRVIIDFFEELRKADSLLAEMVRSARQKDPWAYCDLGTVRLLRGTPDALVIFQDLDRLRPPTFVYDSTLATLLPLVEVAETLRPELTQAVAHLRRSIQYLGNLRYREVRVYGGSEC